VGSEAAEPAWQPSTDAQALAQLRGLIRAYIRGELSHTAFVMQFGIQCLTHDLATPRPPSALVECEEEYCGHVEQPPIGDLSSIPLHNPSCGCDWCSSDNVGPYRGTPAENLPGHDYNQTD